MWRWIKINAMVFAVGAAWIAGGLCYGEGWTISLIGSFGVGVLSAICHNLHDSVIKQEKN